MLRVIRSVGNVNKAMRLCF